MAANGKRITKLSRAALRADPERLLALAPKTDADITAEVAADPMAPPIITGEGWRGAGVILPEPTVLISLRVDREVLEHFRTTSPRNPEAAMAAALRAHVATADSQT